MRYIALMIVVLGVCMSSALYATTSSSNATAGASTVITEQDLFAQKKRLLKQEEALLMEKARFQEQTAASRTTTVVVSALIGVLAGWASFFMMARGWVKSRIKSELDENTKPLYEMLSLNQREADLKKNTRILVLREGDITSKLVVILRKLGFANVSDQKYAQPDDIPWDDCDQVVLDNVEFDVLQTLVTEQPNKWLFAYREGDNYPTRFDTVANANSGITIYPRLMELLVWKGIQ